MIQGTQNEFTYVLRDPVSRWLTDWLFDHAVTRPTTIATLARGHATALVRPESRA